MDITLLSEKTKLAHIDDFEHYFEISGIKEPCHLLREIRRRIATHLEGCVEILEKLLTPDGSFIQSLEAQELSDTERESAVQIIQTFGILLKEHQILELDSHDDAERAYCEKALIGYREHVSTLKNIIKSAQNAYTKQTTAKDVIHYLG